MIEKLRGTKPHLSMDKDRGYMVVWGDAAIRAVDYWSGMGLVTELQIQCENDHEGAVRKFVSKLITRVCNE